MVNGKLKGYIEVGNEDDIIEILQTLFNGYGISYITISNQSKNVPSGFSYSSGFVVHRWDTLSVILLSYSISKIAIKSNCKILLFSCPFFLTFADFLYIIKNSRCGHIPSL